MNDFFKYLNINDFDENWGLYLSVAGMILKMLIKHMDVSPLKYHLNLRIIRSKELLLTSNKNISEISYELGFHSILLLQQDIQE